MALTISQVNQGFLALFGRPATGAEAAKFASLADVAALADTLLKDKAYQAQLSAPIPSFKQIDTEAATDDAFVESAYQALIGRASDAEGKTFWLSLLAAGVSRDQVVKDLIDNLTAQAAEGTADGLAFQTIVDEDKAASAEWIESLYQNLLARASDAEGLDYWSNALIQGISAGQVIAAFAASAIVQGTTTEDGQNFAAKQAVADSFTNAFNKFNNAITANEQAGVLGNLKTMMDGVNKDYQVEQYTDEITKIVNEYQNINSVQFTKADDDDLGIDPETGESNLTSAANFTGTYNLTDETKGTIQSSDRATGTEAYLTDTLTINVTGYDKDVHPEFDLNNLPGTTSVEKLIINNGAASVTGSIDDDFEYVNVRGTGGFKIAASKDLADVVLNSGSSKDGEYNEFTGSSVTSIKTAAGNDKITLTGSVTKALSTGAGDDEVAATLAAKATADLGAGDDSFIGSLGEATSLTGGAGDDTLEVRWVANKNDKGKDVSTIEIDGGTGKDTLDLSTGVYIDTNTQVTDFQGIKSIKDVETLTVGTGTKLMSSAISGQKLTLDGASLVLNAKGANGVDLSKMVNAEGADVAVRVENVKSGNVNLAYGNKDFNNLKETIVIAKDASKVSVKGFEQGNDHIQIDGAIVSDANFFNTDGSINASAVAADNIYFVDLKDKVTKAAINDLLKLQAATFDKAKIGEKDAFYIVATDLANGNNSTAKVYKIEVGKDGTVGKLDQISTISVADKDILNKDDFQTSPNYAQTVYATNDGATIDISNMGNVKIPGVAADGTKLTNINVSGGTSSQDVTVKTAAGQDVTVNVTDPVKSITTDAGNDNVKVAADKVTAISTGAGNDKIDLATTAMSGGVSSTVTTIDGGAGTDTLIISGDAAKAITSMSGIEKIEIKGTSISADAITTNYAPTLVTYLANVASGTDPVTLTVAAPTVKAGELKTINLTNLAQATDDSGAVSLDISGVSSNTTVNLTTIGNKAATSTASAVNGTTETVNLVADANNVTINNIGNGDMLKLADFATIAGTAAVELDLKAATSLTANTLYYTTSLNVKDIQAKLSGGNDKVLVAVNSGNTSKLYSVGKTGAETLVANLSDTIDFNDTISGGAIVFSTTKGGEKPAPAATNKLTYSDTAKKLNLDADPAKYNGQDFVKTEAINVVQVTDALEVSGAATVTGGVNVYATASNGAKITKSATNSDVNVFLGESGDSTAAGAQGFTLTNTDHGTLANVTAIKANTTGVISAEQTLLTALASKKIDASAVTGAQFKVSDAITAATWDLNTGLKVNADDFVSASVGANAAGKALALTFTAATDKVDISAAAGKNGALTITATDFAASDNFKVAEDSVKAVDLGTQTLKNELESGKITKVAIAGGVLKLSKDAAVNDAKLASAIAAVNAKYTDGTDKDVAATKSWVLFTTTETTDAGTYLIYNGANNTATTDDVAIKLSGTVQDFAIASNLLSVTFGA